MEEIWKPVPYKPFDKKYSVSNLGRVKPNAVSKYSGNQAAVLTPAPQSRGYLLVTLYAEGSRKDAFVHRMVALAFHGEPPPGKPYACHKNDCQANNRADNLYWGTNADNTRDRERNGKDSQGEKNGRAIVTAEQAAKIRHLYAAGKFSQQSLGAQFGLAQSQISRIVHRKAWNY